MRAIRPLLFRIFYSTTFTVVFLLVVGFIIVTPADAVRQAWSDGRRWDVGAMVGAYLLTGSLALLIYSSRLYTTRSVLQGIPKAYVPIEKEELPGRLVRREIAEGLKRSALVVYRAKPRFERAEDGSPTASARISAITRPDSRQEERWPTWTHIAHPGWSSPASPDLPNLHYDTVIAELANLIEAKAVSLAPTNPLVTTTPGATLFPDERVVEILQRPLNTGMRDYVYYLDSLGLINPPTLAPGFLHLYECARFSTRPLDESSFRSLMAIFASILRGMTKLDPDLLAEAQDDDDDLDDGNNPLRTHQPAWLTPRTWSPKSASTFSVDQTGSIRHHHQHDHHPPRRVSEDSVLSLPADPDKDLGHDETRAADEDEYAPLPQTHAASSSSSSSSSTSTSTSKSQGRNRQRSTFSHGANPAASSSRRSLRQTGSKASLSSKRSTGSQGSVIRLRDPTARSDLPYTIEVPGIGASQEESAT